jgi:hypothetical protein
VLNRIPGQRSLLVTLPLRSTGSRALKLYLYGSIVLVDLERFFGFLIYTQSVGLLGRGISPSQDRCLHTEQHKHRIKTQASLSRVGFEHTIPVFERANMVRALNLAGTVTGNVKLAVPNDMGNNYKFIDTMVVLTNRLQKYISLTHDFVL